MLCPCTTCVFMNCRIYEYPCDRCEFEKPSMYVDINEKDIYDQDNIV